MFPTYPTASYYGLAYNYHYGYGHSRTYDYGHGHAYRHTHSLPVVYHPIKELHPLRLPSAPHTQAPSSSPTNDTVSHIVANFIVINFGACLSHPDKATGAAMLKHFILTAMDRDTLCRLPAASIFGCLLFLQRLKFYQKKPSTQGPRYPAEYLFSIAFVLAVKALYDYSYINRDWVRFFRQKYELRAFNAGEREMCAMLQYDLNIQGPVLKKFTKVVTKGYVSLDGLHPALRFSSVSKRVYRAERLRRSERTVRRTKTCTCARSRKARTKEPNRIA